MATETPATVRRPPRQVGADPAARRLAPISEADAENERERLAFPTADLPAEAAPKATKPDIQLSTTIQHRGRIVTITAKNITVDRFCDLLDAAQYAAPAPQEWQTLPDGTPLCPKHAAPMKLRERQGDSWYSHNVGTKDAPVYCKGYHGKDSPGYDL